MDNKYFGTDGIRGRANQYPLIPETISRIAMAVGQQLYRTNRHNLVVIGKDTRLSGYMIEPALTAGFVAIGMDVVLLGPLPTPAVAMLTRSLRADIGVMISASHNPYPDNGLKFFGPNGYKLSDDLERDIEEHLAAHTSINYVAPGRMGRARRLEDAPGRYIEFLKNTFPRGLRLDGLRIVVDCANGAAYKVAPTVLWELGADVIPLGVHPDGCNINAAVGATDPTAMRKAVVEHGAHFGICLDGDADRVILADEKGTLLDGDQLLGLIAAYWQAKGRLRGNGIVTTVMSNLGLERYLANHGLQMIRTAVGDRHVSTHMLTHGYNVGGEQSGHIILNDYTTTGDGLIAALQALAVVIESGKSVSDCGHIFEPMPQVLKNIQVSSSKILDHKKVQECFALHQASLGKNGRLLVRKSGTESGNGGALIRVMAEGEDISKVTQVVEDMIREISAQDAALKGATF